MTSTAQTPHEAALEYIRPYVERGDTLQQLKAGQGGYAGGSVRVQIGGYFCKTDWWEPGTALTKIKPGEIAAGVGDAWGVYQLADLYVELLQA